MCVIFPEDHLIFLHECDRFLIECVIDLKFFVEGFDVFFLFEDGLFVVEGFQ